MTTGAEERIIKLLEKLNSNTENVLAEIVAARKWREDMGKNTAVYVPNSLIPPNELYVN